MRIRPAAARENAAMPYFLLRWLVPLGCAGLLALGWRLGGLRGLALAAGALVMWLLLHITRMLAVMRRAGSRPVGSVANAVMLSTRLRPGVSLLHVIALARALGEQRSAPGQEPAIWRWTDASASHVDCTFAAGRLLRWELERPALA